MMIEPSGGINNTTTCTNTNNNNNRNNSGRDVTSSNNDEKANLARTLRRMKRKMFLKAVEQPQRPSDSLREMILKVALEETPSTSFSDVSEALYIISEE